MKPPTFGPLVTAQGVTFRLWAPAANGVAVVFDDARWPMQREGGWFTVDVPGAQACLRYKFRIDDDLLIADPASRFQPDDVQGASEVIDHDYDWRSADWKGRPWQEAAFLELHVGTFTPQGTFRAAIDKLDHVAATGITAIELMPLVDFPGRWNWGYDGVLLYAPDSVYGRPEDLKALIDAAHERGLMVFLDVVYNHFGPEGNYLGRIAPQFFSDAQTPWGGAIDYAVPEVRAFAIENALAWLRDYRFDGLRLDAVHAIASPGEPHILDELGAVVGAFARENGRHIHLVLENDDNRTGFLVPRGRYDAQWNDDFHHAWHVELARERSGYYKDYADSAAHVARTLAEGFAYQGEASLHRGGKIRGESTAGLPPLAFVNFLQNHDQIGNRPLGERLSRLARPQDYEIALAVLLLSPSPPLLFMGEEWGATEPFPFFCDFTGDLAEAVRQGRRKEFAEVYAKHGAEIPDPLSEETVRLATLDWSAATHGAGAARLLRTRALLRARREHVVPLMPDLVAGGAEAAMRDGVLTATWRSKDRAYSIVANLSGKQAPWPQHVSWDQPVWGGETKSELPTRAVLAGIGAA